MQNWNKQTKTEQSLPPSPDGKESLLAQFDNDPDCPELHGCATFAELSARIHALSQRCLLEETDPVLNALVFTGEVCFVSVPFLG